MKKIIIIMLVAMLELLTGCNKEKINETIVKTIAGDIEEYDIGSERKKRAYDLGDDVIFVVAQYQKGADAYECIYLLNSDLEQLEELKNDKYISNDDQIYIVGLWANTKELIFKMQNGDYETEELVGYIYKCQEKLKEGENWNDN